LKEKMDAHFGRFRDFLDSDRSIKKFFFHDARHDELHAAVAQAEEMWRSQLRPLVEVSQEAGPVEARAAIERYKALAPAQVARLDAIVTMIENDVRDNAVGLAKFSATLLAASLMLAALGLLMAKRIVSRPLRRLIDATEEIAAGAYEQRVEIQSHDEVGTLAGTFNRMAEAVSENTARISAFNRAAGFITSSLNARDILDQIMRQGIDVSGARAACLAFYDAQTGSFNDWVTHGLSERFVRNMAFRSGGLADETFVSGTYILSNDLPGTRHRLSKLARDEGIRAFICLPLTSHAGRLGVIYFYRSDRATFLADEIDLLKTFAHLAAVALENARLYAQVEQEARIDALTGLLNRRSFDRRLAEEHNRAKRFNKPYALALLDIDHFKRINDTYGHPAGDAVLAQLGQVLAQQFREVDVKARYGGEEFAVILPEISGGTAKTVAERVRRAIAATPFVLPDGREIGATVSIGVSCYPNCATNGAAAVNTADQALYIAKMEGRNRVLLYRETLKARIEKEPGLIVAQLNEDPDNILPVITAISVKAPFLRQHTDTVLETTALLAQSLGLSAEERNELSLAAQLHDIGMATIPDAVLAKTASLTPEEGEIVRQHPLTGAAYLEQVPELRRIAPLVRHHHEHHDGTGYPDGLKGEAIPKLARVLMVADAYSTMINDWPGHHALPAEQARTRLQAGAGTQFDPHLVECLLRALEEKTPAAGP
ncbi:MAG: hypothetical protein QG662_2218, partial [Pseudomonadota bacterium]|nr:hypothetical protein [Pseudomonadota bacterium]